MTDVGVVSQYIALGLFLFAALLMIVKGNVLLAMIPSVAGLAYFAMIRNESKMETYRYMDWAVTTPLMLIAILSANRIPLHWIGAAVAADLFMVYYGYKATQAFSHKEKITKFFISCLAFLPVVYLLFKCKYTKYAKYLTLVVWSLYPILWYVNEMEAWAVSSSTAAYAVMDVCAKVGLVYFLQE